MQTLSSLCWTVMLTLTLDPGMARNMGFALSCGAVMAIAMFATPMAVSLSHVLPNAVAKGTAVTVAAQMGTLPLQILMEPQLPLWSIPANVLVAPFVNAATILGLIALLAAPVCQPVAFLLVRLAGCATGVVERVAYHLGADPQTCLPWASGTVGASLIVVVEAAGILAVFLLHDRRSRNAKRAGIGTAFHRSPIQTARVWWTETVRMVTDSHFDAHSGIDAHSGFDVHS